MNACMGHFEARERLVRLQVLYCGASGVGKATNLAVVERALGTSLPRQSGMSPNHLRCISPPQPLATEPPMQLQLCLETLTGLIEDPNQWRSSVAAADGIVFVVDAQRLRLRENLLAWADLLEHLRACDRDAYRMPIVVQFNKLDFTGCMSRADLETAINPEGFPSFEAHANQGKGVGQCFSEVVRRMMARAQSELDLEAQGISRSALVPATDALVTDINNRIDAAAAAAAAAAAERQAVVPVEPVVEPKATVSARPRPATRGPRAKSAAKTAPASTNPAATTATATTTTTAPGTRANAPEEPLSPLPGDVDATSVVALLLARARREWWRQVRSHEQAVLLLADDMSRASHSLLELLGLLRQQVGVLGPEVRHALKQAQTLIESLEGLPRRWLSSIEIPLPQCGIEPLLEGLSKTRSCRLVRRVTGQVPPVAVEEKVLRFLLLSLLASIPADEDVTVELRGSRKSCRLFLHGAVRISHPERMLLESLATGCGARLRPGHTAAGAFWILKLPWSWTPLPSRPQGELVESGGPPS